MRIEEVIKLLSALRFAALPQAAGVAAHVVTDDELQGQIEAYAMALEDIPDDVTAMVAFRALRRAEIRFFPSAFEVAEILSPVGPVDWSAAWSAVVTLAYNGPRWVETGWGTVDLVGQETAMDLAGASGLQACADWWGARQVDRDGYLCEQFRKVYTSKMVGVRRESIARTAIGADTIRQVGA